MAQESQLETLDSLSSSSTSLSTNDQSQSSSDPSLLRTTSFSRLNAQAPEFVPIRSPSSSSSSTQTKQVQVPVSLQVQPPAPPRAVIPPPPPPGAMMHHPHAHAHPHVYSPHQGAPFHLPIQNHVIPVHHHQIHHQHHHHVPVQNYHHHRNHNHHQKQNHHHNGNCNQYHHHNNEDHQEFEIAVKDQKENKKEHHNGGLSDESTQKILNQVEYYFSDLNLATTDHLMRFIHKDPEGYVPISVVASFKKIKALISSNSQLASVLRNSSKLVVSEDGKKVKRHNPLTESELEELQSCIVVAENLPDDHCHQNLMKIFSAVGSVKTICTCLPQTSGGGPSSASRTTKAADGMLFSNKLHAFVEYESVELAEKAIAELNNEGNWRSGLRVRLMLRRVSKNTQARGKKGHEGEWHYEEEDTSTSEQYSNEKHLEDSSQQNDAHVLEHTKNSIFWGKMSLISQNVGSRNRVKSKSEDLLQNKDVEEGRESGLKKRKIEKEKQLEMEQVREMKKLENFLFGSLYSPLAFGKEDEEKVQEETENGSSAYFVDSSVDKTLSVFGGDEESADEEETWQKKPVWVDEEEEKTNINIAKVNRLRKLRKEEDESLISGSEYVSRLRAQHVKLNPGTEWAELDSRSRVDGSYDDESSDEENQVVAAHGYEDVENVDDILRTNEDLVVKRSAKLLPGLLEYSRLVDANAEEPSSGPINSVQFHRNSQLLLVAGLDRSLRFFQIDGKRNMKIQSIFLEDCPVRKASFLPNGSQVIIAGRRKFFYSLDLVKAKVDKIGPLVGREEKSLELFEVSPDSGTIAFVGNEGYILLVSSKTKELIGTLKMNGSVRSLAFANYGQQLLSSGGDGQVYHWDLRTRTCIHKAVDEGCINGTSLCTSLNGTFFAAGSDSGIVNIYNREEFLGGKKKPIKTIENLTTKVDFMKFNNDAQILAICSTMKKNSLKLVHIPSFTVFSNWPPPNRVLQYPRCLDFSPAGGFMAMGNAAGKVLLYKLHHYHQA